MVFLPFLLISFLNQGDNPRKTRRLGLLGHTHSRQARWSAAVYHRCPSPRSSWYSLCVPEGGTCAPSLPAHARSQMPGHPLPRGRSHLCCSAVWQKEDKKVNTDPVFLWLKTGILEFRSGLSLCEPEPSSTKVWSGNNYLTPASLLLPACTLQGTWVVPSPLKQSSKRGDLHRF